MIPEVKSCTVTQCFYNRDNECYAHAILVGSDTPACETFAQAEAQNPPRGEGTVGACHITQCEYNYKMSCHACSDISVIWQNNQALCATYEPR
ncbi:MAG TPA: DUF1540 domain-containing protein [Armatimonadota bacterium]|nr:DUF1540 domain-containing protein [Armatimonadota bacterium]HOM72078.1 DUF1540 domain-containing protein [Armatimonadota bacterium]